MHLCMNSQDSPAASSDRLAPTSSAQSLAEVINNEIVYTETSLKLWFLLYCDGTEKCIFHTPFSFLFANLGFFYRVFFNFSYPKIYKFQIN